MEKKSIALVFGGKSPEHEVSVVSARSVFNAIDTSIFDISLIGISAEGKWYLEDSVEFLKDDFVVGEVGEELFLLPGYSSDQIRKLKSGESLGELEAAFLVTHGPNGEDGNLQGLLNQINIPFVGPNVLGSSVAMDKDVCKRLFQQAQIGVAEGTVLHRHLKDQVDYSEISKQFGNILFVKPANMGSSVGVHKTTNEESFFQAIDDAFQYDTKILVEKEVVGRELECAVMGNEAPQASIVGEIVMGSGFYDFESKYVSENNAQLFIPAQQLTQEVVDQVRAVAIRAYQCLNLEGMTRVDVFLTKDNEVIVNEVNTLPGFTSISMYPKLWEKSGIAYTDLITQLIDYAIERDLRKKSLKSTRI